MRKMLVEIRRARARYGQAIVGRRAQMRRRVEVQKRVEEVPCALLAIGDVEQRARRRIEAVALVESNARTREVPLFGGRAPLAEEPVGRAEARRALSGRGPTEETRQNGDGACAPRRPARRALRRTTHQFRLSQGSTGRGGAIR